MKVFHLNYHPCQGSIKNSNEKKPGSIFSILIPGLLKSILPGIFLFLAVVFSPPLAAQVWNNDGGDLYVDPLNTLVGIGTQTPQEPLHVEGTIRMTGFKLMQISEFSPGHVLTTDAYGVGTWQPIPFNWLKSGSNIYYNSGNVGIGTTLPGSKLTVNGEMEISGSRLHVGSDGKVGIGTSSPGTDLHLYKTSSGGGVTALRLQYNFTGNPNGETSSDWQLQASSSNGSFRISEGASPRLVISYGGNVGIGTTTPAAKLDVSGTIKAEEIIVEASGADFVFEDTYNLIPLEAVEQHIQQHKHLPDIPSAKEVEANGVSLGQMQTKLLQKIEELTLYMIDLKKENEVLKERVSVLEAN